MNNYGIFGLSATAVGVLTIIMIMSAIVSAVLYRMCASVMPGLVVHLASATFALVLMVTWATNTNWAKGYNGMPVLFGLLFWAILITLPLAARE